MALIARIVPSRIAKPLSVLVVDPDAAAGLTRVHELRLRGMHAELATTFVNSINTAGRKRFDVIVVRDRGGLSARQLSMLAGLQTTRVCVLLSEPGLRLFGAVHCGDPDIQLAPTSLALTDLVSVVLRALSGPQHRATEAKREPVSATAADGPAAGEFAMEWRPTREPSVHPKWEREKTSPGLIAEQALETRKTQRNLPAISELCG